MCNRKAFYKNWNDHHAAKSRSHGRHHGKQFWKEKFRSALNQPPVNVEELDDKYVLSLFAPGLEKKDFLIATLDNTLSISVDKKEKDNSNLKRQEYAPGDFKRQFDLSEKVNKEDISAKYENGVLIVTLPKLEGFETTRQEINIA